MIDFTLALHDRLARTTKNNLVWSPVSVASALGITAEGARGATRAEFEAVLGDLGALRRTVAGDLTGAESAVANGLWAQVDVAFRDEYRAAVLGWPGGELHNADFARETEGARQAINSAVAKTTHDLIKELLAPGMLSPSTAAVIVNALYLKVAWTKPFAKAATLPRPFAAPSGRRRVPTMQATDRMQYAATDGWAMVTLTTRSPAVVDVLLPDAGRELEIDATTLRGLYAGSRSVQVDLWLPKFRLETGEQLKGPLRDIGLSLDDPDFSGMSDQPMGVDEVVHKAVLRVDEQGFEGAAATAVIMRALAMTRPAPPVPFHVDRPYLVMVRHRETGAIYFMARVCEP